MPEFHYPLILLGLLLLFPLYLLHQKTNKQHSTTAFPHLSQVADLLNTWRYNWRAKLHWVPQSILFLSLAFLIITLAGPYEQNSYEKIKREGIDIIISLDISGSMAAEDLHPNRLEAAKNTIEQFIQELQKKRSDRLGVIVFAARAFVQTPLTFDYQLAQEQVQDIDIQNINQNLQGTGIGNAIGSALNSYDQEKENQTIDPNRQRIIILLTDGENNQGPLDPLHAAQLAHARDIQIFTIGIGGPQGAPIPITDQFGNRRFMTNYDGTLQLTSLDEETLRTIALLTDGQYFRADNEQKLQQIFQAINQIQTSQIEVQQITTKNELYHIPLLLATIFLLLHASLKLSLYRF